jgi:pyruvate,water dikinase
MVQSEAAGVLFTANPLNGRRGEMVVEATLGLGEALVSGRIEPDRYIVEVSSCRIVDRTLGSKALVSVSQPGGGTFTRSGDASRVQALPDPAVGELALLGRRVVSFFGAPQDIEWAWADGQLWLLQSRPITSLFPLPAGMPPEPLQVMFSFGAAQGLLGPMTPLGQDTVKAVFAGAGGLFGFSLTAETQNVVVDAAERLFVNFTGLLHNNVGRKVFPKALGAIEPGVAQALELVLDDPRLGPASRLSFRAFERIAPVAAPMAGRLIASLLFPDRERTRFQALVERQVSAFRERCNQATTLAQQVDLVEEMLAEAFRFVLPHFIPRFGAAMATLNLLLRMAARLPAGEHDALTMTRGLPHNATTQMDLALWEVAQQIRSDAAALTSVQGAEPVDLAAKYLAGQLPPLAQGAIAEFLLRYGMRGLGEIDLGRPRWREDPTQLMQVLQSYLQIDRADQAPEAVFRRGAAAAEAAIEHLAESMRHTRGGRLRAHLVRWAASRMRALAGLRESPKFWAIRVMGLVRAALLESGRELAAAGSLEEPDDLFFLGLAELRAFADGESRDWPTLVRDRRLAMAREHRRSQVPRLLLSDGQAFYEGVLPDADTGAGVIIGSPVSPGVVDGIAHVVFDPAQAQLAPGDILVCPGTDPAWTPLFLAAGGLVMEVGGLMTHGSVVAREYGIPAVVGVDRATTRLRTGQRIQVDGTAGCVTLLEDVAVAQESPAG